MDLEFFGVKTKKVPSLDNVYASECGRLFGFRRWGVPFEFSYMKDKDGYIRIGTTKNGKHFRASAHRLIAETYLGYSKLAVNHIDYNRENNALINLEYVTNKQNTFHSMKAGRIFQGNQILDECTLLAVYTTLPHMPLVKICRAFKPNESAISAAAQGLNFKGFFRDYMNEATFSEKKRYQANLRNKQIAIRLISGNETHLMIAKDYGITKTRVGQIKKELSRWL
jgi:hypothetical protein